MKIKTLTQSISLVLLASTQIEAAELIVTTTGDESGGVATEIGPDVFEISSLRSALALANDEGTFPGADTISFDEALFTQGPNAIVLTNGELLITSDVTIEGPGADLLTLDADRQSRLITIEDNSSDQQQVEINRITMTGGTGQSGVFNGRGGCVLNRESLTVNQSVITGCTASGAGGGLWTVSGDVVLNDSWVVNNAASRKGGGLYLRGGIFEINNSTISGNASDLGGGIYWERTNSGTLNNSTIADNQSNDSGGGMFCELGPTVVINNSTLINNGESGISECNNVEVNNSLITGHSQADCQFSNSTTTNVTFSHSMDTDGSCNINATNHITVNDPQLETLAFFGGLTPTHRPLPDSPVIDAGNDVTCAASDQRGVERPQDGDDDLQAICDIGAVEFTLSEEVPREIIFKFGFDE